VPSRQASPSDKEAHAIIVKIAKRADELDSRFLGTCLIFEWPAAQGLVVVHDNDRPPMSVVIVSNANLDVVFLHVRLLLFRPVLAWGGLKRLEWRGARLETGRPEMQVKWALFRAWNAPATHRGQGEGVFTNGDIFGTLALNRRH
jgi:hypothetical protein